ncbi:PilZ domain-containing protein [Virgibacillus halophilus]|uniref:PilZ domain-containing protein n=1 Tax=Tigheibacillus halophilus TaxID=361280 RepID=A0ABU5CC03_9BACI|nr:PilZ domain-containing protein [Virgibacillus halophilus]
MKRIQRRKFARIEIVSDVAIHSTDDSFQPFTTVTTDLSGGGLAFIIPKHINIHKTSVNIWLAFELHRNMSYLKITGDIVRIIDDGDHHIRSASVSFKDLTRNEEQIIIRYCFEKQRQARRKELT